MQQIADALSVSKNSVSIALNNKPGVSEGLRDKILQTAISLNYAGYGELRKPSSAQTILVSGPEYVFQDQGFYHRMIGGIEQQCKASRLPMLISSVSGDMQARGLLPPVLNDLHVAGLLLVGTLEEKYVQCILGMGRPVVSLDQVYEALPIDAVVTGNAEGAGTAVRYLVEQGHTRIGYVGPRGLTSSFKDRWQGYVSALQAEGLPTAEDACVTSFSSLSSFHAFNGIADGLRRIERFPTAFFCANDSIAIKVMRWLSENDRRVPRDVSVVGFDDMEDVEHLSPPLTTIHVHRECMGRRAVDVLMSRIKDDTGPVTRVVIQGDLKVRASSGAVCPREPSKVAVQT